MRRGPKKVSTAPPKPKAKVKEKSPKVKKHLRKDGTVKRGFTTTGKVKLTTLCTSGDNLARADCHSRGYCQLAFWEKVKPPKTTGGRCQGSLEWAHIKKRHHREIRHDPDNCVCLCSSCHDYFGDHEDEFYQAVEALDPGRHEYLYSQMRQKRNTNIRGIYEGWIAYYRDKKRSVA